jgi:hypothetical protein
MDFVTVTNKLDKNIFRRQKIILKMVREDERTKDIDYKIECGVDTFCNVVFTVYVGKECTRLDFARKVLAYKLADYRKEKYMLEHNLKIIAGDIIEEITLLNNKQTKE